MLNRDINLAICNVNDRETSHTGLEATIHTMSSKPSILHLGDPPRWHADLYKKLETHFTIICPSAEERERSAFLKALKDKRWGNFIAIMRPFWNTGGEMGRTDRELISLLPESVKVYGSAGAGFDWVDTDILAEHGKLLVLSICLRVCLKC